MIHILQNMCKRLVSATGNCFPELVHVGCALLSYDMGIPQAVHTGGKFCQTRLMALTTSTCTTKLGMNAIKLTEFISSSSPSFGSPLYSRIRRGKSLCGRR